jgi:pyruvate/2-oxoglutarate/acetoin dehydrogenase E1 component
LFCPKELRDWPKKPFSSHLTSSLLPPLLQAGGYDIDLIELRSLKPLDVPSIRASLQRTHRLAILDESTMSGGVGATISAIINEQCYDELDAPVKRLCMDDAPVPYASSMEQAVVKRAVDLVHAVAELVGR